MTILPISKYNPNSMRVAFYTLGCKLNQAETESMINCFSRAGFQLVSPRDRADICIVNTCTVTHIADRKSRHWLRLARRNNPHALIVAIGCYVERSPQELAHLADLTVGNKEKGNLLSLIQTLVSEGELKTEGRRQSEILRLGTRVRSLIKIQDGCHSSCAYCIVPRVRPREYSLPLSHIIEEVRQRIALGFKEIVITGTKIGSYAQNGVRLKGLVQHILDDTSVQRLRLSSLQPLEISPELLTLWRDERLCQHFHLALQSGSDSVLRRMRRGYSLEDYRRALDMIKEHVPQAAITTDIMVGFPGETEAEFEQSYSFCQQAAFANIHIFPFSPRPGTVAEKMPNQIREKTKKARSQKMLELARSCRRQFCQQLLGQVMPVLWEQETSSGSGVYSGLTSNYVRVYARSEKPLINQITSVKLTGFYQQGMWGEIRDSKPN